MRPSTTLWLQLCSLSKVTLRSGLTDCSIAEGEFWAHESYDHYVRDADEWRRVIAYVLNIPVKAGYVDNWQAWKWNYRRR
jgi:hypothetical protein